MVRAITPRADRSRAPLSFAQTRLWFFDQLMPKNSLYNLAFVAPIRFPLDIRLLRAAMQLVVDRHEVLRTVFDQDGEEPVQVVRPSMTVPVQAVDLRRLPGDRREAELLRLAAGFQDEPFDLSRGPLLRMMVAWLDSRDYLLVIAVHHVVADGWSLAILGRELQAGYEALARGRPPDLPPLPVQYADFATWQRERLSRDVLAPEIDYWRERLNDLPVLDMPTDRPRPPVQRHRGADLAFAIPDALVEKLLDLARRLRATLFMVLLAAFDILLGRWAGQDDVVVGAPIANRSRPETEGLIGFFVNTLVLRVDLSGSPSFAELVERVRTVALDGYAHQDLPFEKIVAELAPERDLSRNPLVQVIFQLFEAGATPEAAALQAGMALPSRTSLFDLRMDLAPGPNGLIGRLEYDVDLFERPTMEELVDRFLRMLEQAVSDPTSSVGTFKQVGDGERNVLERFAGAKTAVPDEWAHALVDAQAARTPAAVAVVETGGSRVTFAELKEQSDQLARHLRTRGVTAGSVVAVRLPRDGGLVVALLAVLKAGAAYLPLEPDLPAGRTAFMLADAGVKFVVTIKALGDDLPHGPDIVDLRAALAEEDDGEVELPAIAGSDVAWVLYTSGSTGRPKGVPGTHVGLANRIVWATHAQPFETADIACAKSRLGFVDAVCELFAPLAAGRPVVLADEATAADPARLAEVIERCGVTRLVAVPSLLRAMIEVAAGSLARSQLRLVNASGEPLSATDVKALRSVVPRCEIWNIYGATEVAADATAYLVEQLDDERVPIGRPLDNVSIELRDASGELVPVGAIGEIVVGGVGVSPGYIGHATTENHRFAPSGTYRTGDLGRWRPDGVLEHHGRADRQLKIRGVRVEPQELEHTLKAHANIRDAAAVARQTPDGPTLAGYYTVGDLTDPDELRAHLKSSLPSQLIPTHLVELPSLPRLANGKIDYKGLADPQAVTPNASHVNEPPATLEEQVVADVFRELTAVKAVSRHDDFFALGGHSLLATRAVSRIGQRLGKSIELRLIFEHSTVAGFADAVAGVEASDNVQGTRIERVDRERFRIG